MDLRTRVLASLTQQGGRLGAFLQLLHRLLQDFPLFGDFIPVFRRLESGGHHRVVILDLRDVITGLLILNEGEAEIVGADIEDHSDGNVEKTEQHHQLTNPVEDAEVDGGLSGHPGSHSPGGVSLKPGR